MTGREWWNQQRQKRLQAITEPLRSPNKPAPALPVVADKERMLRIAHEVEDGWIADQKRQRKR